jgi:ABC-2 type transport system ATP-binding protein
MTDLAITAAGLQKRYGDTAALDGFDMAVRAGTVHGLLGPNGAGKTTVVRVLATLLTFDAGQATVAGFDVVRQAEEVRSRIAVTGQYAAVDETLSGRQNLVMLGRLQHLGRNAARSRAAELLEQFGLLDAADRSAGQYSGGMLRRLDVAASLVLRPEVLFLDEPTAGLDPRSRNQVWAAVRVLVGGGTTVLLTTQYLEEADQLSDQISVIDAGCVVAEGTADELKARVDGDRIEVVVRDVSDLSLAASIVSRAAGQVAAIDSETRQVSAPVADRISALSEVVRTLHETGVAVEDISLRRPTLDEAFLQLTTT